MIFLFSMYNYLKNKNFSFFFTIFKIFVQIQIIYIVIAINQQLFFLR